jgi:hypothetical protein
MKSPWKKLLSDDGKILMMGREQEKINTGVVGRSPKQLN